MITQQTRNPQAVVNPPVRKRNIASLPRCHPNEVAAIELALKYKQIESLLEAGVLQMDLFDLQVCVVQQEGVRYILRRNPVRAAQLARLMSSCQSTTLPKG